jgi:hypothetical protein
MPAAASEPSDHAPHPSFPAAAERGGGTEQVPGRGGAFRVACSAVTTTPQWGRAVRSDEC